MAAMFARRQKVSGGSSAKRRRPADIDEEEKEEAGPQAAIGAGADKGADNGPVINDAIEKAIERADMSADGREAEGPVTGPPRVDATGSASVPLSRSRPLKAEGEPVLNVSNSLESAKHIRVSTAVDFQRDICKQYKLRGTCNYGDSCKFLHEREDHAASVKRDKKWQIARTAWGAEQQGLDKTIVGCAICRTECPKAAVRPNCGHICCETCFMQASKKATARCAICNKRLGHVAESVS